MALRIANLENIDEIYCDSQLLVDYWSKGYINPKTKRTMDTRKLAYILECSELRRKFELKGGKITKIFGNVNKADFGFHK